MDWAHQCPEQRFHVFGKGRYFDFNPAPSNLTVFKRFIAQAEIPALLARYRACAMPTRLDSQGVMSCEMASFGIPLFTSDIEVTREVLGGFANVCRLPTGASIADSLRQLPPPLSADDPVRWRFDGLRLASKEIEFATEIAQRPTTELQL